MHLCVMLYTYWTPLFPINGVLLLYTGFGLAPLENGSGRIYQTLNVTFVQMSGRRPIGEKDKGHTRPWEET